MTETDQQTIDAATAWYRSTRPDLTDNETWSDRCKRIAPNMFRVDPNMTSDLVEAIDMTSGEVSDNWQAILSASEATAASSLATDHAIGERNELRADHLRITDRPFISDPITATARIADYFTAATTSTVVRKRSKRGQYSIVRRFGQSLVSGDTRPPRFEYGSTADHGTRVPNAVIEHALEQCKRGHGMYDAIGVTRIASIAYELPALIGAELINYSEVIPEAVSVSLAGDPYNYAAWSTGPYSGHTRYTARTARFGTRTGLPFPRARSGEVLAPKTVGNVTARVAPDTDTDHLWIGHRRFVRVASVRGKRSARVYAGTFSLTADPLADLSTAATDMQRSAKRDKRPAAYHWHAAYSTATGIGGQRGTITVTATGRLSVTLIGRPDLTVRGVRTITDLIAKCADMFDH